MIYLRNMDNHGNNRVKKKKEDILIGLYVYEMGYKCFEQY